MVRQFLGLLPGFMLQLDGSQCEIFQHRHVGIQVKLLEHHRHVIPYQLAFVLVGKLRSVNVNPTAGRFLKEIHAPHSRGFTRPGRPYNTWATWLM